MARSLVERFKHTKRVFKNAKAIAKHPLHKSRPLRSVLDWARLTLASKLTPTHQITIPYIQGAVLHWPIDATSVTNCLRYGLGEFADMAFCLHLLREEDLFCDVGANAGVYTILAARAVGCKVVAAEPVPRTFDLLMQNIYANGVSDRVDARPAGVGHESGRLSFTTALWSFNHVVEADGENTVEVDILTLDSMVGERVPTLIKIDVEGYEAKVLEGAARSLRSPELMAVLVEKTLHLKEYGATPEKITEMLLDAGLSGPYWYSPENRQLIVPGRAAPTKYNQIFIRDHEAVSKRLNEGKSYEIHGTRI